MGDRPHINADGQFQSDKYPTCPAGKVPLSVKDPTAQDLLWEYAQRRRKVDAEFGDDLEFALRKSGYMPSDELTAAVSACDQVAHWRQLAQGAEANNMAACVERDAARRERDEACHASDQYAIAYARVVEEKHAAVAERDEARAAQVETHTLLGKLQSEWTLMQAERDEARAENVELREVIEGFAPNGDKFTAIVERGFGVLVEVEKLRAQVAALRELLAEAAPFVGIEALSCVAFDDRWPLHSKEYDQSHPHDRFGPWPDRAMDLLDRIDTALASPSGDEGEGES